MGTGPVAFTATQLAPFADELGATTLDQVPGTTSVPEPGSLTMLATGLGVLAGLALWKKGSLANLAS